MHAKYIRASRPGEAHRLHNIFIGTRLLLISLEKSTTLRCKFIKHDNFSPENQRLLRCFYVTNVNK